MNADRKTYHGGTETLRKQELCRRFTLMIADRKKKGAGWIKVEKSTSGQEIRGIHLL